MDTTIGLILTAVILLAIAYRGLAKQTKHQPAVLTFYRDWKGVNERARDRWKVSAEELIKSDERTRKASG